MFGGGIADAFANQWGGLLNKEGKFIVHSEFPTQPCSEDVYAESAGYREREC
jgi:hypothetical protein